MKNQELKLKYLKIIKEQKQKGIISKKEYKQRRKATRN